MRVRLIKHWKGYKPGRVFCEMGDGAANLLIKRGMAELEEEHGQQTDRPAERKQPPKKRTRR